MGVNVGKNKVTPAEAAVADYEALIRAWPTFGQWLHAARSEVRLQIQLQEAAEQWASNGENADFLWGGVRLATVEAQLQSAALRLNAREQQFLAASRAAEAGRRAAV